jgi:4-hydroxysphinganine ceramide fatty acyl 2-hydroxylase
MIYWSELSTDWEATDDFHPDDTEPTEDFEKNQFLDLRRPLLWQLWEANFRYTCRIYFPLRCLHTLSKSYYLKQVHQPRHLAKSARLFGNDYLEV